MGIGKRGIINGTIIKKEKATREHKK